MSHIFIKKLHTSRDLSRFIRVPWLIYEKDPNWIAPLMLERRLHLSKKSNAFFKHAYASYWIACRGDEVIGRISAQVDLLFLDTHQSKIGFWGMLEAINDERVFRALFDTASNWLKAQGMTGMAGPFNLSINQECGLLIKGYEHPPFFMMGHNPPYYLEQIERLGHRKAKDLIAYLIDKKDQTLDKIKAVLGKGESKIFTRPLDKKNLESELDSIFSIFNNAWSENWGFVPFTRYEYLELGKAMSHVANPKLIRIAILNGEAAGFIVLLPNLNEILKDMNGKLFPINWLKLLWRLRFHSFNSGRVVLMGVLKKYQGRLTGAAISLSLIRDVMNEIKSSQMKQVELSWILEDNIAMRRIIEALGARPYKTYRIFEKVIA